MANTSVVNLSQLEGAIRVDHEFYRSDILTLKDSVARSSMSKKNITNTSWLVRKADHLQVIFCDIIQVRLIGSFLYHLGCYNIQLICA